MASKKKELLPHALQLHGGKPHENVSLRAWLAMERVVAEQRYAPHHIADLITVRNVVTQMKEMAAMSRYRPPFTLVQRPVPRIQLGAHASPILALLGLREPARQIKARAGEVHEFHPYFEAFLEVAEIGLRYEDATGEMRTLEYDEFDGASFSNHPKVALYCATLNDFFVRLGKRLDKKSRAAAKAFERTPSDNRQHAMRYAAQLIDRAPRTRIVHVTIRRHLDLYGNPVSQDEIRACRQMLSDYLDEPSPKRSHLGHCSFLRRFSDVGYCLDAFVFLSDSFLKPAADIARDLTEWWEAFAPKSTACVTRVLPPDKLVKETLDRMTLVTEPDFYVRPARLSGAPKKLRHFWCTQFPVNLRAARRRGKAGSYRATADQSHTVDPLLEALREEEIEDNGVQKELRWRQAREKEQARRSANHKKGARTRAKNRKTAEQERAWQSARFEACKSRIMYDDEIIDVEAAEVIDVAQALRRHSRRRTVLPSASATPRHADNLAPCSPAAGITPNAPEMAAASSDRGVAAGSLTEPRIFDEQPGVITPAPGLGETEGATAATSGPATNAGPKTRRRTSEKQERDKHGRLRTIQVEVRRASPLTRSSTAMKKAPNNAEANTPSAESGFDASSPHTTSDPTE
ncbi:hypothetical protein [Burkholderia pseudomallei]|uniref:hypothetical protein n=1 Tax=Burkholderia pseudomallei TaxID=28450 RepID=UPI001177C82D|nr:hypothetical protein [Burkholderia pseudomallei]